MARQREYVVTRSDLYRELCQGYDVPDGLEDLPSLPLVDKEVLRASQRAFPPSAPISRPTRRRSCACTARVARRRGMNLALSEADALDTAEIGARAQRASGSVPVMS